jgi:hypothetical protein
MTKQMNCNYPNTHKWLKWKSEKDIYWLKINLTKEKMFFI